LHEFLQHAKKLLKLQGVAPTGFRSRDRIEDILGLPEMGQHVADELTANLSRHISPQAKGRGGWTCGPCRWGRRSVDSEVRDIGLRNGRRSRPRATEPRELLARLARTSGVSPTRRWRR